MEHRAGTQGSTITVGAHLALGRILSPLSCGKMKMFCGVGGVMELEEACCKLLQGVTRYFINDGGLHLSVIRAETSAYLLREKTFLIFFFHCYNQGTDCDRPEGANSYSHQPLAGQTSS
jgi:hypothetical protein